MKLIIDIPEEYYNAIKAIPDNQCVVDTLIIKYGKPLPKGHGRLIDADALKKHKYHDNNRFENAVAVAQIDWADTIIEADKEEEQ